jgi:hypothetical protein
MEGRKRQLIDTYTRLGDSLILRGRAKIMFYCEGGGEVSFLAEKPELHGLLAVRDESGKLLVATDDPLKGLEKLREYAEREKGCRVTFTLIE